MQVIKFVHVLRRIESIERDIEELHSLENNLPDEREYAEKVRIAIELEINNLLNEKIKLMELKIENPPEKITEMVYPQEKAKEEKNRSKEKFPLEEMEKDYIFDFLYGSKKEEVKSIETRSSKTEDFLPAPRREIQSNESSSAPAQESSYRTGKTRDQIIKELRMID